MDWRLIRSLLVGSGQGVGPDEGREERLLLDSGNSA